MEELRIWMYAILILLASINIIFFLTFISNNFSDCKTFIKQIFCIHKYKTVIRKDYRGGDFKECIKCEKIKS